MTFWQIIVTIATFLASYYIGFITGLVYGAYKIYQREKLETDAQNLIDVLMKAKKIAEENHNEQ